MLAVDRKHQTILFSWGKQMSDKIVLVTGGFDPIHSGHISYLNHAQHLGDMYLIVGLNSDEWLVRKKGKSFMSWQERMIVIDNLHMVDEVIAFDDSDNTSIDAIRKVREKFPDAHIIFANGGDRTKENIPEMSFQDDNLEFVFGIGGDDKKNSSSWLLKDWKSPETERNWGSFLQYYESDKVKVKRLIIKPNESISMQYHLNRSELWFIESGEGHLYTLVQEREDEVLSRHLKSHDFINIEIGSWHRLKNVGSHDLCVIEIQYGTQCSEEDIVRNNMYK